MDEKPLTEEELAQWSETWPLEKLPDLPARHPEYSEEPWAGICTILILSVFLVWATMNITKAGSIPSASFGGVSFGRFLVFAIWSEAFVAAACCAFILCAGAGVIHRSPNTCYPIPEEVLQHLQGNDEACPKSNISESGRTYCIRCFVWRPAGYHSHHCSTCQRCVTNFDHHCGVFGRCIVGGNMPCFVGMIAMMFAGWATAGLAFLSCAGDVDGREPLKLAVLNLLNSTWPRIEPTLHASTTLFS